MKNTFTLLLLLCSFAGYSQNDTTGGSDYPLIKRLHGYYISSYRTEAHSAAPFINPQDEKPVLKNGKKFVIRYRLKKDVSPAADPRLQQKKGVEETIWYHYKNDDSNYYYLLNKPGENGEEYFPVLNIWIHQSISADRRSYTLTIIEEDVDMTALIKKKMDTLRTSGRVELYTIYFGTNKYQFESSSELTVNEMVNFLKKEADIKVRIIGSADSTGSRPYNLVLSEKRATYIREALIKKGIEPARLQAEGVGETTDITDTNRDRALQLNRRTVLIKE